MAEEKSKPEVATNKRSLLTLASGAAGLIAARGWVTPVVKSVALPAHAQSTCAITIFDLHLTNTGCGSDPDRYRFYIEYKFTSVCGITSHVLTANCQNDGVLNIADGSGTQLGDNLLLGNGDSVAIDGNEFKGTAQIQENSIMGTFPLNCDITVTLRDANGGQASATINAALQACIPS